ncbi:MAG: alpha-glucosidase, partial [Bacteroidota bacterium]|nr:alpha-glucosidase [Bacteroidota bacterium]
ATPFIYNGDEIGMTNIRFDKIDDYRDVETKNMYERLRSSGGDTEEFLQDQRETARDNSRTPIQWNDGPGAGFSEGTPWIRLNENYKTINEADCEKDPDSILQYFKKMISLRKKMPVLVYGDYNLLESPGGLYVYIRSEKEVKLLVILNFSKTNVDYTQDFLFDRDKDVLINNYPEINLTENIINLFPYQALIINIK